MGSINSSSFIDNDLPQVISVREHALYFRKWTFKTRCICIFFCFFLLPSNDFIFSFSHFNNYYKNEWRLYYATRCFCVFKTSVGLFFVTNSYGYFPLVLLVVSLTIYFMSFKKNIILLIFFLNNTTIIFNSFENFNFGIFFILFDNYLDVFISLKNNSIKISFSIYFKIK